MADTKISALSALSAQPASNDLLPIVDVSDTSMAASGTTKKITAAYFAQTAGSVATITGGGTIALGGFTLTVPATGSAALLGVTNVFTVAQTITPSSSSSNGLVINTPASATAEMIKIESANTGASAYGPLISIGRNSNASGASGWIRITGKSGGLNDIWVDASATPGVLRIGNGSTSSTDTGGSVVGAQTSSLDKKDVIEEFFDDEKALAVITGTRLFRFCYKDDRFGKPEFLGIITDYSPIFGADPDDDHPNGRILNEVNAHGYVMAAIKALNKKIDEMGEKWQA